MTKRTTDSAIVLKTRPYRETSLMIDFFTREHGRLRGVHKGYRGRRNQRRFQAFLAGRLDASFGEGLASVYEFETTGNLVPPNSRMASGFYVLELTTRALYERQNEPEVFDLIYAGLSDLGRLDYPENTVLRHVERSLLDTLGYGIDFAVSGRRRVEPLAPQAWYAFATGQGFRRVDETRHGGKAYQGGDLLKIAAHDYSGTSGRVARELYQSALTALIGHQPLESRKLLQATAQNVEN